MIRGLPHKMAHLNAAAALAAQTCQSPAEIHPLWDGIAKGQAPGLLRRGYDDILFELRTKFGTAVCIGDSVKAHLRDEVTEITGGRAPHKPESTGLVYVSHGQYYPGVYALEWVALL